MTGEGQAKTPWWLVASAAVTLVAIGAAGTYVWMRHVAPAIAQPSATSATAPAARVAPSGNPGPLPDVVIALTPAGVQRSGIVVTPVRRISGARTLRLPGTVEPNAYRQVAVTSLVSGRVTGVSAALGDRVSRGQPLAQVYSQELTDAQTRYLTMSAELEAAHQRLRRTERLVEIGAASVQELETMRAEHTTHATDVEAARARLTLLGLSAARIAQLRTAADLTATLSIPSPLAGVITERTANVGLNVDPATALFKVVDLSTVWVIANLYERDFASVKVGSPATVTSGAFPGLAWPGKVSYIDPQVSPETRTTNLRVEVVNRSQQLRLDMYVDVAVDGLVTSAALVVPRTAVQTVGDRPVVYLADPTRPTTFVEREVRLGDAFGTDVQVASGVVDGDRVVAEGSFSLRAEQERLGLRSSSAAAPQLERNASPSPATTVPHLQQARIVVGDTGFDPASLKLRAGIPARMTFVRTSGKTCATEVVFPTLNIRKSLPLNEPVTIDFTPEKTGEVTFACGMNMLKGKFVVDAR